MKMPGSHGRRVALFGGSFDPPHPGHLAIARAARDALQLDEVLFAPVGAQPLKPGGSAASFDDRVAMTRLAIEGERGFDVSLIDAPKPGLAPNYTYDTLVELRSKLGAQGELFCLMGADSLHNFSHWHRAAEIPFVAALVVASRPGQSLGDIGVWLPPGLALRANAEQTEQIDGVLAVHACLLENAGGSTAPLYLLSGVDVDVSATEVRAWLRQESILEGRSATAPVMLPARVLDYIHGRGLYR
jgi:nicotinate-nucleotide adenylyltransferase